MSKFKVSIIIPVYNSEKYLDECLESIVDQSYKNIEVILVDDYSTDNSRDLILKYSNLYTYIKYSFNDSNKGAGYSRNIGISMSSGDFICFCDSDDTFNQFFIEKMLSKVDINTDIVLCDLQYETPKKTLKKNTLKNINIKSSKKDYLAYSNMSLCRMMTRDILWNDLKIPTIHNGEDASVIPILFQKSREIAFIDEALYNYKLRKNSTSIAKPTTKVYKDLLYAFSFIEKNILKEYFEETEFLGINLVVYGATFNAIKAKESKESIFSFILDYEKKYPKYSKNKYIKSLGFKKCIFIYLVKYRIFCGLVIYSKVQYFLTKFFAS